MSRATLASPIPFVRRLRWMAITPLAIGVCLLGFVAGTAQAVVMITCGETQNTPGSVSVISGEELERVSIPANTSALAKCADIAAAFPGIATSSGNTATFNTSSIIIVNDVTGATTEIHFSFLAPATHAVLYEVPALNPDLPLSKGLSLNITFSASSYGPTPLTYSATGDGTTTAGSYINQFNTWLTGATGNPTLGPGLNCNIQITIPITPTPVTGCKTQPFDPSSVSIQWDGNTAADLLNFGLEIVPEPSSALMVGTGLMVLWRWRRRDQE